MDDIFASLEAEEKKMKKEAKRKAKAEKAGVSASGVVAAKKPKMANAASALPTTNTNQAATPASSSVAAMAKKPFLPPQMQGTHMLPHQHRQPPKPNQASTASKPTGGGGPAGMPMGALPAGTSSLPHGVKRPVTATMTNEDSWKKASKASKKRVVRTGGGQIWEDETLKDWDPNDYRVFCGDLGNDVTDEVLARTFGRYPSFTKAKVIRDKKTNKTKGFGFVSFKEPGDFTKAMREMNGKYVGSRPIKMRKSNWKDRNIEVVRQKQKQKQEMGFKW